MKSKPYIWLVVVAASCALAWAEDDPAVPAGEKAPVVTTPDESFKETSPPDIGLQPGALPAETLDQPPSQDIPKPGAPPMPEWWSAGKSQLDKEIDRRQGSAGTGPQSGDSQNAAETSRTTKANGWSPWKSVGQVVAAFAVVLALMIFLNYLMGRFGKKVPILAGASLGTLLGRLHLSPKACLYFIRVKGKVLIVGVTPTSVSAVAEMDATEFDTVSGTTTLDAKSGAKASASTPAGDKFLSQLKTFMRATPQTSKSGREDDEIATLRSDIARLRRDLKEGTQERGE